MKFPFLQSAVNAVWNATHTVDTVAARPGELTPRASLGGGYAPAQTSIYDGEKFAGGFGTTEFFVPDYWTLRARSNQIFTENPYARGIIRRLITNEINTGLSPEAMPDESIIGVPEDSLDDWTEDVENRFAIWGKNPAVCDKHGLGTFGALQRAARMEALISGDVLVMLHQNSKTGMPQVQLISGALITTPLDPGAHTAKGNTIDHGVERNSAGVHVAFWLLQDDFTHKRLPAFGPRTGRRISWLVYGTDKRLDAVRGEPMLAIVLQSLKEIDRYRDAVQRKTLINSLIALQIVKTEDKPGTLPISGGALRRDAVEVSDSDGMQRQLNLANLLPGLVVEEMQHGEEIKLLGGEGTDINFGPFEEAIVSGVAWALEIPPEILRLSFSNNYSASQAAINEFKIYINRVWSDFGETMLTPVYTEFLISAALRQKISAPSLLAAWRDPAQYDTFGAWLAVDWYGSIKPSTDMLKAVKASKELIAEALSTHAREARVLTGTKYSKNIKRLKRENEQKVEAMRPLAEFKKEFEIAPDEPEALAATDSTELEAVLEDILGERNIS